LPWREEQAEKTKASKPMVKIAKNLRFPWLWWNKAVVNVPSSLSFGVAGVFSILPYCCFARL
jgi:hypothetical protein